MRMQVALLLCLLAVIATALSAKAETAETGAAAVTTSIPKKTMNLRGSPLGVLVNYFNADLDIAMSETWTLGPTVSYWNFTLPADRYFSEMKLSLFSIGARGNWYPSGVFKTGFFMSPMFQYSTATASTSDSYGAASASASVPVITALAGYQWFGETLNFSLGAGLASGLTSTKVKVQSSSGSSTTEVETRRTAGLALDLMLGYTF